MMIGAKTRIPPKYTGNFPTNSPIKISPGVAGEASTISLKPISVFLKTVFNGYIKIDKKKAIIPNSIINATPKIIPGISTAKVGMNKSKSIGANKKAHNIKEEYRITKNNALWPLKRFVLSLSSFLAIIFQRLISNQLFFQDRI